jgi:hypothetical protein
MTKKLLCFVQDRREEWGDIAWKQIAGANDYTIYPKKGYAKAKNVDSFHA